MVELHCHLEGALHLDTLWELSQRHEPGRYASFEELKRASTVPPEMTVGFKPFLAKFDALRFHYGTSADIEKLACDSANQFWGDAYYREIRFSPVFFARRFLKGDAANSPNVPLSLVEEAAAAVIAGVELGAALAGYEFEFILTCSRHFGYEVNKPALDLLKLPIGNRFKGLDLAGDESVDASAFVAPFREWQDAGKMITIHAGEDPNAGGPLNIVEALDVFKADRIGHGVRAIEDAELVARLADEKVPLELCPTSNLQTRAVKNAESHPIKKLFDAGVCVTISTDDPTICGTDLKTEYEFASRLGMSDADLKQCTLNAVRAGVWSDEKKQWYFEHISKFGSEHAEA